MLLLYLHHLPMPILIDGPNRFALLAGIAIVIYGIIGPRRTIIIQTNDGLERATETVALWARTEPVIKPRET